MNKVLELSKKIVSWLKPYSKKIEIVGSIRRKEKHPRDIDIVLIPKDKEKLVEFMSKKAKFMQGGEHESTWRLEAYPKRVQEPASRSPQLWNSGRKLNGVKVELYYTTSEEWGAELLAYSSRKGSGIGLRVIAKKKGMKLTQHGLFRGNKKIAGKTEKEIYSALGRKWKKPEDR